MPPETTAEAPAGLDHLDIAGTGPGDARPPAAGGSAFHVAASGISATEVDGRGPGSWSEFWLVVAWTTFQDIHVKLPLLIIVALYALGQFKPDYAEACNNVIKYAATWGGASAMAMLSAKSNQGGRALPPYRDPEGGAS